MNEFYVHLEVQTNSEGQRACIPTIFENKRAALAKHYTVLAIAAENTIPYHASFLIRSDGVMTDGRIFKNTGDPEFESE